jgi:uncharacterized membrane protein
MESASQGFLLLLRVIALVEILYAIPFILKRVPPNKYFGFRMKRLVPDEEAWYEANRIFGIASMVAGAVTGAATFVVPLVVDNYDWGTRVLVVIIVVLVPLMFVVTTTRNTMEKRLKER